MDDQPAEILLVEDNAFDAELTLDALKENKLANHIQIVRDGAEALEFLFCTGVFANRISQNPKLILLDLKLPKLGGIEVLRAIRDDPRTHTIPVVILTSSRQAQDVMDSYNLGVNSYIVKPVNFDQFVQSVQQIGFYWLLFNEPPTG